MSDKEMLKEFISSSNARSVIRQQLRRTVDDSQSEEHYDAHTDIVVIELQRLVDAGFYPQPTLQKIEGTPPTSGNLDEAIKVYNKESWLSYAKWRNKEINLDENHIEQMQAQGNFKAAIEATHMSRADVVQKANESLLTVTDIKKLRLSFRDNNQFTNDERYMAVAEAQMQALIAKVEQL